MGRACGRRWTLSGYVMDSQRLVRTVVVPVACAAAVLVAGAALLTRPRDRGRAAEERPTPPSALPPETAQSAGPQLPSFTLTGHAVEPLVKPEPRPDDYVGSQACTACHQEIARLYDTHSMAHSMAAVGSERVIETYEGVEPIRDGALEYVVERQGDDVIHRERAIGDDGRVLYDLAQQVRFALGSGVRGRSYVIDHAGRLFQSPLGWYSQRSCWDLSPGYRDSRNLRFDRPVRDGCLYCHAGRVVRDDPAAESYGAEVFAEASIGCERCHGPGGRHVAVMEALPPGATCPDMAIVNPADLDPQRREAVCNQCHLAGEAVLPRFGRGLFDFRPGDRLDDTLAVFVSDGSSGDRPVSQVEQMRESRCFKESAGRLGCTSCHDPHFRPPQESFADYYRQKCAACHDDGSCTAPAAVREAPPAAGSCIHCHMPNHATADIPHTASTNHRVVRHADEDAGHDHHQHGPKTLVLFDGAESRIPRREIDRIEGLLASGQPDVLRDPEAMKHVAELLVPKGVDMNDMRSVLAALEGDDEALMAIASLFMAGGRTTAAVQCWEQGLANDPANEEALLMLCGNAVRNRRSEEALSLCDRLIAVNPSRADYHARRAAILASLGRRAEAIEAARRGLELDPALLPLRAGLAQAYGESGMEAEAAAERELLEALKAAGVGVGGPGSRTTSF